MMPDTLRVLYVDDEPGLLEIGKLFLEKEGEFAVDTLTSAREALDQLNTERYDAIISDYQMPEMDGITFLKQLKASGNATPFIIFTGRGREEVVIEALNEGADFYIQKGGEPKAQFVELANKIRYAVSRRRSEEKLGASVEEIRGASSRYEALIAASNTGAWEYHADSGFLWCSPEYFSMLGRDIRDFDISGTRNIEHTWIDLLHPEDREFARRQFDTYLGNPQGMYEQYFRVLHKDGHWVWVWSRGRTIRDAGGKPTSVTVGTHIDVTDRKHSEEELLKKNEELHASYEQIAATDEELRANLNEMTRQEQMLRESEEKFKTLFESAADAIIIMDRHVFLDCNRRTEEIYRRTREQIIGHFPAEFSPERQPDGLLSAEKMKGKIDAAYSGENRFFEWTHVHPGGTPFIVEVSLNRFMVRDAYYLQAIVRDITGRKQNEEQVVGLSKLKEKLLEKRSLLEQLKLVSESCIKIFGADFARIWLIEDADLCEKGCMHAAVTSGPEVCNNRFQCLHLVVSSGRYTHINGGHRRVPFGCYKIGRIASGEDPFFITNDVVHDPRVHDHNWAQSLGLISFAGFRLLAQDNKTVGVLALFRDRAILPDEETLLVDLANTLSHVIISGIAEEEVRIKNEELHAAYEELTSSEEELRANLAELTRQELTLREKEEKISLLLNSTAEAIYGLDMDGNCTFCNASCLRLLGYNSTDELLGRNMHWQIHAKYPDGTHFPVEECRIFQAFNEGEGTHVDDEVLWRSDGTSFPAEYWSYPQRRDGVVVGAVVTFVDITERKRAEEALQRVNQKLNVLTQLTRKDLTSQTFVLSSYLELTKNQLAGQDQIIETLQKGIQEIRSINKIIEYSKDYQDMGAKPPVWHNVNTEMLLGLSHISIGNIRHSIETGDLEIYADPLLEKVCQRLFENSVKHGDHVTLIRVWHTVTPEGAIIFFEDDGAGIPEEKKEQIFSRIEGTSASRGSLIFVREILDITGITIIETGEPGKGARFEITVPKGAWRMNPGSDQR